jgi:hypothetical protein
LEKMSRFQLIELIDLKINSLESEKERRGIKIFQISLIKYHHLDC